MIARLWHGRVPLAKAESYHQYLLATGLADYASSPGNCGVSLLKRKEDEIVHYYTLTYWTSMDAIKGFAGEEVDKARYYPQDADYLLEMEPAVTHFEVIEQWRPAIKELQ